MHLQHQRCLTRNQGVLQLSVVTTLITQKNTTTSGTNRLDFVLSLSETSVLTLGAEDDGRDLGGFNNLYVGFSWAAGAGKKQAQFWDHTFAVNLAASDEVAVNPLEQVEASVYFSEILEYKFG